MSGYHFSNNNQYKQFLFISIFIHMYIWSLFPIRSILYDYNHQFSLLHTCVLIMKHYPMLWILRFLISLNITRYNETGHQYNSWTNPLPVLHIYEVTHVGKTFSYNRLIMGGFLWCQNWSSIPSCFMYIFSLSIMLTVIIIKMYCCVGKPSKKDETV